MTRQLWNPPAGMAPAYQQAILADELNRCDVALAFAPDNRRWRKYRGEVHAALMAIDPPGADILAMSDDDLARELSA